MATKLDGAVPITWNQVNAFRLSRHHLLERAPVQDLISVVDDMVGTQAQLLSAAQISLWSRLHDLRIELVDQALREKTLVKAACMRHTLFLVPAGHLAVYVRGTARHAEKEIRWARGKGIPDRLLDAAIDAVFAALDQPRSRAEIAAHVSRALGVQVQAVRGGGWGSRRQVASVPVGDLVFPVVDLLHLAAARGVICYGPYRLNEPTFVRADAWISPWQDLPAEQAEDLLLRRYLRTFGPVTAADFAMWCGITLTEACQIWARAQAGLAAVRLGDWTAQVLREDLDALVQAVVEPPSVRLLPYFDSFLLGHKDRSRLVPVDQHVRVYRAQGWIAPVVLVDGRVAAVWEFDRRKDCLQITVSEFWPLSSVLRSGINNEARDLARFLNVPDVDVHIA